MEEEKILFHALSICMCPFIKFFTHASISISGDKNTGKKLEVIIAEVLIEYARRWN